MGAKLKYKPEYRERIIKMTEEGKTRKEIAKEFGVSTQTIRNWVTLYKADAKRVFGRPALECDEGAIEKAGNLALLGLTKEQIDAALGVSMETRLKWERTNKRFSEAINNDLADAAVARALHNRAKGSVVWEERIDMEGNSYKVYKQLPPSEAACIFWLKNRSSIDEKRTRPIEWKDKREHEINESLLNKVINGKPVPEDEWVDENLEWADENPEKRR